jgi:hypothetical protein
VEKPFKTYLVGEAGIRLVEATGSVWITVGSIVLAGTLTWSISVDSIIIAEFATKFVD